VTHPLLGNGIFVLVIREVLEYLGHSGNIFRLEIVLGSLRNFLPDHFGQIVKAKK
jgi:hypothetical protein